MSLLVWTGNPFVDGGIAAILVQQKKNKPEDIFKEHLENVSEFIQSIYVTEKWKKAIYSIFVNYPLSQPSYKTEEKKREKLKEFLDDLLSEAEEIKESGDCIACGRRNTSKRKNRQHIPMTGSGGVTNYFSFTADGADYCDICAFAVQCSPLTYYACGKLGLLHTNSPKILRRWANITLENIQQQKILKNYTGCFNEGFTNPQNALFHLLEDLTRNLEENWKEENPSLRLYHFTNYIQGPDLDIYDLPTSVFRFFAEIRNNPKYQDWRNIVRRGYFFVKKGQEIGLNTKEKTEDDYKNSKNRIYQKLLSGRSILPHFLNIRSRKAYGDFSLLEVYLKEVLNMNKTRIETIKKVADEIANFIRASDKGKARLRNLEESTKFRDFCNVLRRISMERIALLKPEKPLFTLDEVAEELFPEGALTFGETRYLILFRLYEQLHDWLLAQGLTPEEADDGIQDSGNDGILILESNTAQILEGENYQ
ncbi:MAG: type I-B CRISPR-associated protein Cas8b1/Cst1 [Pyrinomonadaceae bacterium]